MSRHHVFTELRIRFDAEAVKHPGIRCWGAFGPKVDWLHLPPPTSSHLDRKMGIHEYGLPQKQLYEFWGCPAVSDLDMAYAVFQNLAAQSGDRLLALPKSILLSLDIDFTSVHDPIDRWLQLVFSIGWSGYQLPGLARSRHIDRSMQRDTESFSSEIQDLFTACAVACAWIIDHEPTPMNEKLMLVDASKRNPKTSYRKKRKKRNNKGGAPKLNDIKARSRIEVVNDYKSRGTRTLSEFAIDLYPDMDRDEAIKNVQKIIKWVKRNSDRRSKRT